MDKCGTIEKPHRLFRQLLQFTVGEEALLHGGSVTSLAVEGGGVGGGGVLEIVGVGAVGPVTAMLEAKRALSFQLLVCS